jgi:hypothetical protein
MAVTIPIQDLDHQPCRDVKLNSNIIHSRPILHHRRPEPQNGNVPIDACNAYYNFDLSFPAAVAASVLFGLLTVGHVVRAVAHRKVRLSPVQDPGGA